MACYICWEQNIDDSHSVYKMGRSFDLTCKQQMVFKALSTTKKTQGKISRQVGCSQCAVSKCLQGKSSGRKKRDRKRVAVKRDDRKLAKLVRSDRFQGCGEIVQQWNANDVPTPRSTTYRRIKKMGYTNYIPRVKPLPNFKQYKKRLTWATEKRYWTVGQWSRVIVSDKSKFCISFGNQEPRVWKKPYKADKPGCTKSSTKFPQSTMVWGEISAAGVGPPCFPRTNVTAAVYQEVLEHFLLATTEQLFGGDEFAFQHYGLLPIMPNPPLRLKPQVVYHAWDTDPVLVGKLSGS